MAKDNEVRGSIEVAFAYRRGPMPGEVQNAQIGWDFLKIGVGFVAGSITPLLVEWAKRALFKPKLEVRHDNDDSYTPISERTGSTSELIQVKYLRVRVKNVGNMIAKGCRAYLVRIEEIVGSESRPTFFRDTLRLRWAYEEGGSLHDGVDIPPGIFVYFDVISCELIDSKSQIFIQFAQVREHFANKMQFDKTYRFAILIASEGADPKEIRLAVNMGPSWRDFVVVDPRPITIEGSKPRTGR